MFGKLTDHVVYNQLTHYVVLASCLGRVKDRRLALKQLIDLIGGKQGESVLFFNREDSRYFVAEFDGVRLMTVYESREGDLEVEAIDNLPESAASIIIVMLSKAIQIKTLEWHVEAIDRQAAVHQRGLQMVQDLGKVVSGGQMIASSNNSANPATMIQPTGPRF